MQQIQVLIFVESRYKVNRKRIKMAVNDQLRDLQVSSNIEVSVAIVGDRKMKALNKKYRNKEGTTNVLSFPLSEGGKTPQVTADVLSLGDIVISYPQVIVQAAAQDRFVDDKIDELVKHGLKHLLGIHHE